MANELTKERLEEIRGYAAHDVSKNESWSRLELMLSGALQDALSHCDALAERLKMVEPERFMFKCLHEDWRNACLAAKEEVAKLTTQLENADAALNRTYNALNDDDLHDAKATVLRWIDRAEHEPYVEPTPPVVTPEAARPVAPVPDDQIKAAALEIEGRQLGAGSIAGIIDRHRAAPVADVQRYTPYAAGGDAIVPDNDGRLVLYSDHAAVVARLNASIASLEADK